MKKKSIVLAFILALALPISITAQGGIFQRGIADEEYYGYGGTEKTTGIFDNRGVQPTGIIDNQTFGQDVPMGGGIIVLLAAGAGYSALKRKEEQQ